MTRACHLPAPVGRLRELQRRARSVTISTVVTAANVHGLADLARFLAGYHAVGRNVHAWHLYQFLPLGRGGRPNGAGLSIPTEDCREACAEMQRLDLPFRVLRRTDMYRSRTVEFFWSKDGSIVPGSEELPVESPLGTSGSMTIL